MMFTRCAVNIIFLSLVLLLGQLGHGGTEHESEPKRVIAVAELWLISADGGNTHSLICDDTGCK